jgi:hypothetical protein
MSKKRFKNTKVGSFLIGEKGLLGALGDSIPDKGLLGLVKNLIDTDRTLSPLDKERALEMLKMDEIELENVTARWVADSKSDSWLAKNVRPIIVLYMTFSLSIYIILDSYNIVTIKPEWLDLLTILTTTTNAAYFGSRGLEKYNKIKRG